MTDPLRSLVNELSGFLDVYRLDMRHAAGNTNVQVLQDKLDAARLALDAGPAAGTEHCSCLMCLAEGENSPHRLRTEQVQQITKQNFIRLGIAAFKEHELREIVATFCKLPGIAPAVAATPGPSREMLEIVRDLRARRIMCDGGNGNVYDIADDVCEKAADFIEAHLRCVCLHPDLCMEAGKCVEKAHAASPHSRPTRGAQ